MRSLPKRDFQFFMYPDAPADPSPLSVKTSSSWTYCGPLLQLRVATDPSPAAGVDNSCFPPSFHHWSTHSLSSSLLPRLVPFLTAVHTLLRDQGLEHYWITVRASLPTNEFDQPRWHVDDDFFSPPPGTDDAEVKKSGKREGGWKVCTTLLGSGTLFAADGKRARRTLAQTRRDVLRREKEGGEHVCLSIRCAACGRTADAVREEMADRMAGEVVVQSGYGEGAVFRVGSECGAVHSEPRMECGRVFVNIVPGTEGELRRLMGRWGLVFPRSWSLGVPLEDLAVTEGGD
ncbi:hypothetical protein QBC47DRAFT_277486, partial [Echria macrotheca]